MSCVECEGCDATTLILLMKHMSQVLCLSLESFWKLHKQRRASECFLGQSMITTGQALSWPKTMQLGPLSMDLPADGNNEDDCTSRVPEVLRLQEPTMGCSDPQARDRPHRQLRQGGQQDAEVVEHGQALGAVIGINSCTPGPGVMPSASWPGLNESSMNRLDSVSPPLCMAAHVGLQPLLIGMRRWTRWSRPCCCLAQGRTWEDSVHGQGNQLRHRHLRQRK